MAIVTLKQQAAFPEVGQIRKGSAKIKNAQGNMVVGKDLGRKFRVVFYEGPGNKESAEKFAAAFGAEPEAIKFVLPFNSVDRVFDCWYESYTAGRLIARADGERFIRLIDPQTGTILVENGEPYTKFDPKQPVAVYTTANGKEVKLFAKPISRVKIFVPALERWVYMTVHSSSIYDAIHLTEQFAAISELAAVVNKGSIAGIPLVLSRRMTAITWVDSNGTAKRVEKGLLNIEIAPSYFAHALAQLGNSALSSGAVKALSAQSEVAIPEPTLVEIAGPDDDEGDYEEAPYEEVIEEAPVQAPAVKAPAPVQAPVQEPTQAPVKTEIDALIETLEAKLAQETNPGLRRMLEAKIAHAKTLAGGAK